MDDDNDLDFTHLRSTEPVPQPTREQMAEARQKTISGMPTLKKTGYYVNITNRPTQRIIPRSQGKYELLIIDHEQNAVLPIALALMLAGFNVRSAENREEIVTQLKKPPLPDALMLDVAMPGVNGLDLLARIHQHPQLQSTPILVITSKFDEENVAAALARGASGYMTKPCKPETLVSSVHAILGVV